MTDNNFILSLVTFLPLVGALGIFMIRGEEAVVARNSRYMALWASLVTFVLSLWIWFDFERGTAAFQSPPTGPLLHVMRTLKFVIVCFLYTTQSILWLRLGYLLLTYLIQTATSNPIMRIAVFLWRGLTGLGY